MQQTSDWLQAGGTAAVIGLLFWLVSWLRSELAEWKDRADRAEVRAQNAEAAAMAREAAATAREKEIGDKVMPVLREVAAMLPQAIEGVEAARSGKARDVDNLLRRLETIVEDREP